MRVVITGASGFLGQYLVRALKNRDIEVVPVSRQYFDQIVRVHDYSASPGGDVLVHLAEDRDRVRVNGSDDDYFRAKRKTLDDLLTKEYKRVIYVSSAALYDDGSGYPIRTNDPISINDNYTRLKYANEEAVLAKEQGFVVRLTNVYGEGMDESNVISTILKQVRSDGDLYVNDISPVRDFIWVDDVVEILENMCNLRLNSEITNGIFNVGTGVGVSIGDIAKLALEIARQPERKVVSRTQSTKSSTVVLDISATTEAWGWVPKVSLCDGLTKLLEKKLDKLW
ncbi:MAG: NAD(P)-dependent oxidoreductase [Gammaproteobacteria bacterium]|nr:NAD(P)-dependent oxidoreductase [Gammaproteobacteria bacterium]